MLNKLLILAILLSGSAFAEEEPKAPPPMDPEYNAEHGFALVNANYNIYAYLLSDYRKPRNYQLLYKLKVDQPITLFVRDSDKATLKTKAFNLEHLIRGQEEFEIEATVYTGHFDKGGFPTYQNVNIVFQEQTYVRKLTDLDSSNRTQVYDSILLKKKERMLVHQIQLPPSYDHLILFYDNLNCVTQIRTSSAVPPEGEILGKLTFCGPMKPLYFETESFQ